MELRVKQRFLSDILRESAQRIRTEQQKVVSDYDLFESGELRSSLQGHFSVTASGESGNLSMSYLKYARFLDLKRPATPWIKRKEGYHLYNRIVFGNIYNYTLPSLRYGLTDELKQTIGKELAQVRAKDFSPQQ